MLSTVAQIRACNDKLLDDTDVTDAIITDRISAADSTVIVDLSTIMSEADILSLGASNKVINLLSTYKAVELTLARNYGVTRNVDQISDIQYWEKKYNLLIGRVLDGEISLASSDEPVNSPVITSSTYRKKLFPRKGIDGFEEGYVDDEF